MERLTQNESELEYIPVQEELDIITEMLKYVSAYASIPDIEGMRRGLERELQAVGALPEPGKHR